MIEFKNVSFKYPDSDLVLKSINLKILPGERVAVIGANGSGKTTFAFHVNGILTPSEGEVCINGLHSLQTEDNRLLKQKVGLVFQNPDNQLVSTTVEREIAFSLENMNTDLLQMEKIVNQMLEHFDLSDHRHRLTSDMSGGEKQRLALASVMVANPEILILDEPGSYLDRNGKQLLDETIRLLKSTYKELTIIRITQYSSVALKYDRVIVFHDGVVALDGTPDEVFNNYDTCRSVGVEIPLKYRIKQHLKNRCFYENELPVNKANDIVKSSIKLDSVGFKYNGGDKDFILKNINLKLYNDKVYGLVGPTGCGKTTLIQLMAGLLKNDTGRLSYDGFKPGSGNLAVLFQQPERQFFLSTVDREIKFAAENMKLSDIDKIAEDCYELIGFDKTKFSKRDPFSLSGGEKRRLAFGTILSLKPSFIFFDEPTCGLDYNGIKMFIKLVKELSGQGIGIVIISHHSEIILDLADDVICLKNGQIQSVLGKERFFKSRELSDYLLPPELISFQLEKFGTVKYLSETELAENG